MDFPHGHGDDALAPPLVMPEERAADGPPPRVATRGEQTKAIILETALRLFRERGYDETTMRAVAAEAGVSVGNAYHYFDSKEQMVQAFYDQIAAEHRWLVAPRLATTTKFAERLRIVVLGWLEVADPYRAFAGKFFKVAAEPTSPLSPFSGESIKAREANIALFREVLEGSTLRVEPELRAHLPELLWLYHLGVVLYWVHDRSDDVAVTRAVVDRTIPLVDRLVRLSHMRVLRPLTRDLVDLLHVLAPR